MEDWTHKSIKKNGMCNISCSGMGMQCFCLLKVQGKAVPDKGKTKGFVVSWLRDRMHFFYVLLKMQGK